MTDNLFTTEMFSDYLNIKKISNICPCCNQNVENYVARGMEFRANVIENGKIVPSSDENDNVGLGLPYTVIDANGLLTGIRDGAYGVFLFRCENCGFVRAFDAAFVKMEYNLLKREEASQKE
ncbi:hypothetical protein HZI61_05525 [Haemophilus influenzae]|uniref:hypothetical protein n=1 Tax=Haemophilus influenzae TaxID=727 RepID=UPI0015C5CE1C|nr:hypothetical protein [Haemophilus influenzae]NXZ84646.1 hypothetical protein [Haemophilus influenzae]